MEALAREPQSTYRSTLELVNSHILKSLARKLDEDIEFNYAHDVVVFTPDGIHRGKLAARNALKALALNTTANCDEYEVAQFSDNYAYIERRCGGTNRRIGESLFLRDGLIAVQMVHVLNET